MVFQGSCSISRQLPRREVLAGIARKRSRLQAVFEHARPLVRQQAKRKKGLDIEQTPQVTPSRPEWDMALAVRGK